MPFKVISATRDESLQEDIRKALGDQEDHQLVSVVSQVELVRFFHDVLPQYEEAVLLILDGDLPLRGSRKAKQKKKKKPIAHEEQAEGMTDAAAVEFIASVTSSYDAASLAERNAELVIGLLEIQEAVAFLYVSDRQKRQLGSDFDQLHLIDESEAEERTWPEILHDFLERQKKK